MKTKTIWESASRPLFVRSVWLESPHKGRGVQHRHFILDYDPPEHTQQRGRQVFKTAISPTRNWEKEVNLRYAISCDLSELSASYENQIPIGKQLHIGSAKIKLQQPINNQHTKQQFKLLKFYRRPSFTKQIRKQSTHNYDEYSLNRRMRELQELYSRHSSLQDLQTQVSTNSLNPEERLAERVLNWLDLAGKQASLPENLADEIPIEVLQAENMSRSYEDKEQQHRRPIYQRQKVQQTRQQLNTNNVSNKRKMRNPLNRHYSEQSKFNAVPTTTTKYTQVQQQQRDAVKPITIIFDREGYPVRLNRPARNIDLCSLTSSAGTTRRLAGSLASARLYPQGNDKSAAAVTSIQKPAPNRHQQQMTMVRASNRMRMQNSAMEAADKSATQLVNQKRLHEDFPTTIQTQDSKRQLHIFMPSLPKKSMATTSTSPSLLSGYADDSSIGLLSQRLNEKCKL